MAKINQAMQDLLRYNAAIVPGTRSGFDKSHSHTTTFDSAYLVPVMWDRVLPGDEKKIRFSGLARMNTPKHPVMDQANLDVWAFYVPDRLWWTHAREFYGENKDAEFNPDGTYVMPYLTPLKYMTDPTGVPSQDGIGSLNDYFGFPVGYHDDITAEIDEYPDFRCTAGLHRSYQLIWNEWFRNSSIQPALHLSDGDQVSDDEWEVIRQIRKVNKYPDYYTSLLREPQAGNDVYLPLGEWAPVVTRDVRAVDNDISIPSMNWNDVNSGVTVSSTGYTITATSDPTMSNSAFSVLDAGVYSTSGTSFPTYPVNLWADLTSASAATINNLRAAITVQQLLEVRAMAGKRYQQILQATFGTFVPDATLQRPELLGASRTPIGMRQVLATANTDGVNASVGSTGAFSLTNVANEWICNKSFVEPGFIIVLAAVRVAQSYSQGLNELLTKINPFDHYYPVFDHLGNQPVPASAVYFSMDAESRGGDLSVNDYNYVFGYKEYAQEYRMMQNRVSGLMRPDLTGRDDSPGSLSSWNYAIDLGGPRTLNSAFIEEDDQLIDRTVIMQSEPQFMLDCYFEYFDYKPMSVHSVPGLLRL